MLDAPCKRARPTLREHYFDHYPPFEQEVRSGSELGREISDVIDQGLIVERDKLLITGLNENDNMKPFTISFVL